MAFQGKRTRRYRDYSDQRAIAATNRFYRSATANYDSLTAAHDRFTSVSRQLNHVVVTEAAGKIDPNIGDDSAPLASDAVAGS